MAKKMHREEEYGFIFRFIGMNITSKQGSNLTFFVRCQPGTEIQKSGARSKISVTGYIKGLNTLLFRSVPAGAGRKSRHMGTHYFEPCPYLILLDI